MFTVRPTHILSSVFVAGVLVTTGCGGSASKSGGTPVIAKKTPAPQYSAAQVSAFFRDVTGDPLETDASVEFDSLSSDHGDYRRSDIMSQRYGNFLIYVLHAPGADAIYKSQSGRPIKPDPQGIYWHDEGGEWTAMKPYHNVVLSWTADEQDLDERFERLDKVLSQLGKPADQVRAALPPEDQPCDGDTAGTCRDEHGATVTTVERGQRLKLPTMQVRLTRVETGRVVIPPNDYGLVRRAKGRFVLAAMRIKNTGNEPLRGLWDVKLKIGDKTYDQSSEATWTVTPLDAFPVQPGDSTVAALVFDLPLTAAREAVRDGVLAFPAGDELATVEDAAELGQIRLGKPGGSLIAPQTDGTQA